MILFSQEEINRIMFKFSLIIHAKIPLRKTAEGFDYSLPPAPPRLPPELPELLDLGFGVRVTWE